MKEGLIRLTDEKDIFYDSIEKVYRYRMHCPNCGKVALNCQCYHDLDRLLGDIDDGIADYTCSAKCALLIGEWDELDEAMASAGLSKDLKTCLSQLTEAQSLEELKGYDIESVLMELYNRGSDIPISHLKNPTREEILEILWVMGDVKDILWNLGINYYPEPKDLTEEEASKVLDILTEDADFDYPSGEDCTI
jgi:hypothetical protein